MSNRGGVWGVRLRVGKVRLWLPVPVYVFEDLFGSIEDICAVLLPPLHLPNYAAMLRELLASMGMGMDEPLVDIQADGVSICVKKIGGRT